jgi:hypothetical protein
MNMKTRQSRRQTVTVSHSRWVAYATAGAATALAGSNFLEAGIHYSVVDRKFPGYLDKTHWFQLDQPGDSIYFAHDNFFSTAAFNITGIASAAFRGLPGTSKYSMHLVSKFSFGQSIAAGHFTHGGAFGGVYGGIMATGLGYCCGQWSDPGIGFVGFRFNNGAGTQYGWARVRMKGTLFGNAFKVLDFAYGDPGERITAGQGIPRASEDDQEISDDQGPDEGSLGGLALGAVGLLAWRKSRSRTARSEGA